MTLQFWELIIPAQIPRNPSSFSDPRLKVLAARCCDYRTHRHISEYSFIHT